MFSMSEILFTSVMVFSVVLFYVVSWNLNALFITRRYVAKTLPLRRKTLSNQTHQRPLRKNSEFKNIFFLISNDHFGYKFLPKFHPTCNSFYEQ